VKNISHGKSLNPENPGSDNMIHMIKGLTGILKTGQ